MKEFKGEITIKIGDLSGYASFEEAVLAAEVYLNGNVSSEMFKRFGIQIRVHMKGD